MLKKWAVNVLVGFDQLANAVCRGRPGRDDQLEVWEAPGFEQGVPVALWLAE
jgi:hypothetical protein